MENNFFRQFGMDSSFLFPVNEGIEGLIKYNIIIWSSWKIIQKRRKFYWKDIDKVLIKTLRGLIIRAMYLYFYAVSKWTDTSERKQNNQ